MIARHVAAIALVLWGIWFIMGLIVFVVNLGRNNRGERLGGMMFDSGIVVWAVAIIGLVAAMMWVGP